MGERETVILKHGMGRLVADHKAFALLPAIELRVEVHLATVEMDKALDRIEGEVNKMPKAPAKPALLVQGQLDRPCLDQFGDEQHLIHIDGPIVLGAAELA